MGAVEISLRGQLLIASPALGDSNFRKTVILVAEHTPDGAMGLVLNRRTPAAVADAAPHLVGLAGIDASVWIGGPVDRGSVFVLADFEEPEEAGSIVLWDIGLLPPEADPELFEASTRQARVFAGYAGWGPGQLEGAQPRGRTGAGIVPSAGQRVVRIRCRSTSRTTHARMTAVEYQWHRALTCTDTRSDHWVAVSVCGCAEYILSTFATGARRRRTQI